MKQPAWLTSAVALAIHGELLAEHGGSEGARDLALLESAIARPRHLMAYGEPTLAELAAAYAFGLAKNHAFIDGNKRAAFACCDVFLQLNGYELSSGEVEATATFLDLAAGQMSEAELSHWIQDNMKELEPGAA